MAWTLLTFAAALALLFWWGRHRRAASPPTIPGVPPAPTHPPRMTDDPSLNLGRRKDDEVGGES